ncbi:MAG: glutamate racemase [Candidatus Omnitrophica bacterium]|nr:glutamate racemase [Candidatus Omnitrophota bacterium]
MDRRPIGIFDSGVGGLTVLRQIEQILPNENLIYFGDTARVPYGGKSKDTIVKFSTEIILFLLKRQVKMVIIACNTGSALALEHLKDIFRVPIIGVIEAGVKQALTVSKHRRIGVIGTKSTVLSKSYELEISKQSKDAMVFSQACPLFVPLVEEGLVTGKIVNEVIRRYLAGFKKSRIDSLILGCTHYPLLKPAITAYLKDVVVIDSAKEVARHAKDILLAGNIANKNNRKKRRDFFVSDDAYGFKMLARQFLKGDVPDPELVNIL